MFKNTQIAYSIYNSLSNQITFHADWQLDATSTNVYRTLHVTKVFKAEYDQVFAAANTGSDLIGNPNSYLTASDAFYRTYMTLEELNNYEETTDWT